MTTRVSDDLSLTARFERVYRVMRSPSFLEMKGQIGEVPYFVLAYKPSDEPLVSAEHKRLVTRLRTDGLAYLLGDVDGAGIARADVVWAFLDKMPAHEAILRGALKDPQRSRPARCCSTSTRRSTRTRRTSPTHY